MVPHHYSFIDNCETPGAWLYRIKQIDLDGTVHFSDPARINITTNVSRVVPADFALEQNYPNPFNASTILRYQLPTQSHVTVTVFDVLGREVITLVDEVEEAGYKSISLSASGGGASCTDGMASGVYYYRIAAGEFVQTKKLVVLR
jgi:hypothetical protein